MKTLNDSISGSFEMKKLRLAILGKNEKNLDDLSHMDGESVTTKLF